MKNFKNNKNATETVKKILMLMTKVSLLTDKTETVFWRYVLVIDIRTSSLIRPWSRALRESVGYNLRKVIDY